MSPPVAQPGQLPDRPAAPALNLPVGTSLARAGCGLPRNAASAAAAGPAAAGWVLRVLAWVFAALFVAGFTSAVRKT